MEQTIFMKQGIRINSDKRQEEERRQIIYGICERFFELCLKCSRNKEMNDLFNDPANTVGFLTDGKNENGEYFWIKDGKNWEGVGMKLPKETRVILDSDIVWPTLYITNRDNQNTITVKESAYRVWTSNNDPAQPEEIQMITGEWDSAEIKLPISINDMKDYRATLIMPSIMAYKDMLTTIVYEDSDQEEIILTTC